MNEMPSHQQSHSTSEDDKLDVLGDGFLKLNGEQKDSSPSSALTVTSNAYDLKHRRSGSKWNDDISQAGITITEATQAGELFSGPSSVSKLPIDGVTLSDEMGLLVEQVKMLAGEIAFNTSTLKRLVEQSVDDPETFRTQIQNLENEIHEKRKQMRMLEMQIVESGEALVANASMVEMQQMVMKLTAQCSEKGFELEIKTGFMLTTAFFRNSCKTSVLKTRNCKRKSSIWSSNLLQCLVISLLKSIYLMDMLRS